MNTLYTLAATTPLMLQIIFWVLLILTALGFITWRGSPNWPIANGVVILILLAILGWAVFGF